MKDPRFVGLILAAGRGKRLGKGPKAFVKIADETLLERARRMLHEVGVTDIVAVLPPESDTGPVPDDLFVTRNPRPESGPLKSTQLGLQRMGEIAGITGVVLYPVDHHQISAEDIRPLLDAAPLVEPGVSRVVPSYYGTGGHPIVILELGLKAIWDSEAPEHDTLRGILSEAGTTRYIEAGGEGILRNLNTPEDLKGQG
jgi:nicotine blue oxidoreductase